MGAPDGAHEGRFWDALWEPQTERTRGAFGACYGIPRRSARGALLGLVMGAPVERTMGAPAARRAPLERSWAGISTTLQYKIGTPH